jgi:hypothetical protein
MILSRYSEFDKYAELHNPVLVPAKHFETLLNNFDENHLHDFFKAVILELMPCELFKKEVPLTPENLLRFIFAGTYLHAGIFQHFTYYTDDEGYLCLIFRHIYGIKWSKLIANIFGEIIKITIKSNVLYTILPSSVMLKILEKKSDSPLNRLL